MEIRPLHTKIDKSIQTTFGTIVLENPVGYPRTESNLYCLDADNNITWKAEKPEPNTHYSRMRFDDNGETISTYTLSGHACDVDPKTGKILNKSSIQ